jgi:hypothetical protein
VRRPVPSASTLSSKAGLGARVASTMAAGALRQKRRNSHGGNVSDSGATKAPSVRAARNAADAKPAALDDLFLHGGGLAGGDAAEQAATVVAKASAIRNLKQRQSGRARNGGGAAGAGKDDVFEVVGGGVAATSTRR